MTMLWSWVDTPAVLPLQTGLPWEPPLATCPLHLTPREGVVLLPQPRPQLRRGHSPKPRPLLCSTQEGTLFSRGPPDCGQQLWLQKHL